MELKHTKQRVEAVDADLSGSVFENVNLSGAKFNNVNLAGITITDANFSGASISHCRLDGTTIEGIAVGDLLAAYRARNA